MDYSYCFNTLAGAAATRSSTATPLAAMRGVFSDDENSGEGSVLLGLNDYGIYLNPLHTTGGLPKEHSPHAEKPAVTAAITPGSPRHTRSSTLNHSPVTVANVVPMPVTCDRPRQLPQHCGISVAGEQQRVEVVSTAGDFSVRRAAGQRTAALRAPPVPPPAPAPVPAAARPASPASPASPEERQGETKTEEFFRLAAERKRLRLRQLEAVERADALPQKAGRWYHSVRRSGPAVYSYGDSASISASAMRVCATAASEVCSEAAEDEKNEDVAASFPTLPTKAMMHTSYGSCVVCSFHPSVQHEERSQQDRQAHRRGCGESRRSSSRLLSDVLRNAFSSKESDVSSADSDASSAVETLLGGEREYMGVCAARDFRRVGSPNWAALATKEVAASAAPPSPHSDESLVLDDVDGVSYETTTPRCSVAAPPPPSIAVGRARPREYRLPPRNVAVSAPRHPPLYVPVAGVYCPLRTQWPTPLPAVAGAPQHPEVVKRLCNSTSNLNDRKSSPFTLDSRSGASCASSASSTSSGTDGCSGSGKSSTSPPSSSPDAATARPPPSPHRYAPPHNHSGAVPELDARRRREEYTAQAQRRLSSLTAAAAAALLPRKEAMQRFRSRFSTVEKLLLKKVPV